MGEDEEMVIFSLFHLAAGQGNALEVGSKELDGLLERVLLAVLDLRDALMQSQRRNLQDRARTRSPRTANPWSHLG